MKYVGPRCACRRFLLVVSTVALATLSSALPAIAEDPTLPPAPVVSTPAPLPGSPAIDGVWSQASSLSRAAHTAIYDSGHDRMVVFGGWDFNYRNDVWALSLPGTTTWAQLEPTGTPPSPRAFHTAIYDPLRDRMLVFGGYDGAYYNAVWALSLSGTPAWTQLSPTGAPPSARAYHKAIYDPVRDRMLVFGGYDGAIRNDVWALSLAGTPAWTQLSPTGTPPSARYSHTAIYDPVRDRMLVFGGYDGARRNDSWALSLAGTPAWTQLSPTGTPPSGRSNHAAIYDPVHDRMVVFGGYDGASRNDAWELSLSATPAWTQLTPADTPPSIRFYHAAIYDPARDRILVFGGRHLGEVAGYPFYSDAWALSNSGSPAWTQLSPTGTPLSARDAHTAFHDPKRGRMVIVGGYDGSYRNDVWVLSLYGAPAWTPLSPAGAPPAGRYNHTAIYDPVRDRVVVFGGYDGSYRNDVWALSLPGTPAWAQLSPTGTPPTARSEHTAIYDPVRDRMLVFGGYNGAYDNAVWALSLSGTPAWTLLSPTGTPPTARGEHTAIYDPVRDRMVVFGGHDGAYRNDSWALSLAGTPAWAQLSPTGAPPTARAQHTAIYDPVRDRMVVFGGHGLDFYNDTKALSLSGTPSWTLLAPTETPPSGRYDPTAIYDPVLDRMLVFGGYDETFWRKNDVWALTWGTPATAAPVPTRRVDSLRPCYPNPFNPRVTIPFELREDEDVTLSIYDVSGRLVKTLVSEWTQRGPHTASWDGRSESGEPVSSGVYFCRLHAQGFSATQKIVLLK